MGSSSAAAIPASLSPVHIFRFPSQRSRSVIVTSPSQSHPTPKFSISQKFTPNPRSKTTRYSGFCQLDSSASSSSSSSASSSSSVENDIQADNANNFQVQSGVWKWKGYSIRYQYSGSTGPALVLVHGFGANSDHWRKNIPVLAKSNRVYSIDLIGYGYSAKPNSREFKDKYFYTFETWATQLNDFCTEVVEDDAFYICNSIGGLVGLQAAVMQPRTCRGIVLLNISLRMLHIKKQPWFGRPFIRSFQSLLRNTVLGKYFFKSVATPETVRSILCQCYHDTSQVTEELVQLILQPGLDPGAADVFLEFICYSEGPLPEELLPQVMCPVLIGWGDKDPWEPIEIGRAYQNFDCVEDFIALPDVGHCPQDEAPHLVNPLVESFVARHATIQSKFFCKICGPIFQLVPWQQPWFKAS